MNRQYILWALVIALVVMIFGINYQTSSFGANTIKLEKCDCSNFINCDGFGIVCVYENQGDACGVCKITGSGTSSDGGQQAPSK